MSGAALVVGQGIQAFASMKQGADKRRAYLADAENKRAQAAQVDIAANREIDLAQRRADKVKSAQITAFGRSGVQLSGSALFMLEESAANAISEINSIRDAADYKKKSILTEADYAEILGEQAFTSGFLGALGSGVSAFAKNPYSYDRKQSYNQFNNSAGQSYTDFGGIG